MKLMDVLLEIAVELSNLSPFEFDQDGNAERIESNAF